MEPIDLGTTRLADKLKGAVGVDMYAALTAAVSTYTNKNVVLAPVVNTDQSYHPTSCAICSKSRYFALAAIGLLVFFFVLR